MASTSDSLKSWVPTLNALIPAVIIYLTVLSVPLAIGQSLHMTAAQTTSWIMAAYGLPSLLSLVLTILYRQPIILTANLFALIFYGSLVDEFSYPEIIGATIVAGAIVVLISVLGLTRWLVTWVPAPIIFGLLAGAIVPYVFGLFSLLGTLPLLIGAAFLAYLLSRLILGNRIPPVLPALVVGLLVLILTGQLGQPHRQLALPDPVITLPVFSLTAIATATPVLVILMTLQANVPSIIFMRSQGYQPPALTIDIVGGISTMLGSFLGPMAVSIPLPFMPLFAGREAGEFHLRHRAAILLSIAGMVIAGMAVLAADVPAVIPTQLLLALVGLSMVSILVAAMQQLTCGPLLLGPVFAFTVALSKISLLGFGPFFWALVIGIGTSLLLERDKVRALRLYEAS